MEATEVKALIWVTVARVMAGLIIAAVIQTSLIVSGGVVWGLSIDRRMTGTETRVKEVLPQLQSNDRRFDDKLDSISEKLNLILGELRGAQ